MQGTISRIDHGSGRIELTTKKGPVQVYFVPEMIKNLKAGDKVEVAVELQRGSLTAGATNKQGRGTADQRDMEECFPYTIKPDEDIAKKSKQVGS